MIFNIPRRASSRKSEEEILAEFSSTLNPELLGELYSGYMHLVYGVCLKYLRNREEAMDAVMQIFEKLITEIPRQKIDNFRNWLHVVTKNYCLMQLRSKKSQDEKLKEWMNDPFIFMETGNDLHPIDGNQNEMEEALIDCVDKLKSEQRDCIRQFYFSNRCYKEIAADLGLDEKKVKSYLQNAKRNLKLCIEEKHVGKE